MQIYRYKIHFTLANQGLNSKFIVVNSYIAIVNNIYTYSITLIL